MASDVDRCGRCGQYIYLLTLWVTGEVIAINAGTKPALLVEDLHADVHGIPAMKLTEAEPVEIFTRHKCNDTDWSKLKGIR